MSKTQGLAMVIMHLTDNERSQLKSFLEEHGDCVGHELSLITSYANGIGDSLKVRCHCNEKYHDITDYGSW